MAVVVVVVVLCNELPVCRVVECFALLHVSKPVGSSCGVSYVVSNIPAPSFGRNLQVHALQLCSRFPVIVDVLMSKKNLLCVVWCVTPGRSISLRSKMSVRSYLWYPLSLESCVRS